MEPEPIRVLDREAVRELLEENGDSTEYCLVVHNRAVEKVCLGAWNALPGVKGRGSSAVPKLRSLDLSFNRLAEVDVQVFAPLGELRELKLYSNRLTNEGLEECGLEKLTKLERLELHDNKLSAVPEAVARLGAKLKVLRLERNQLTGSGSDGKNGLRHLGQATSLTSLNLDCNEIRELGTALGACQSLELLSVADNELEMLPRVALQSCRRLRELVLSRNMLNDRALQGLAPLGSCLTILRLDSNHLESIASLPPLKDNRLLDGTLSGLPKAAPNLEVLDISNNRITKLQAIIQPIKHLRDLREISVAGNPCTSADPSSTVAGDEWWRTVRDDAVQLHYVDDLPTGRGELSLTAISSGPGADRRRLASVVLNDTDASTDSGQGEKARAQTSTAAATIKGSNRISSKASVNGDHGDTNLQVRPHVRASQTSRPGSARMSQRPGSARQRSHAAKGFTSRVSWENERASEELAEGKDAEDTGEKSNGQECPSLRPVMHPPSSRTAYGTDFKLEPLEDMQLMADDFRNMLSSVRGEMASTSGGIRMWKKAPAVSFTGSPKEHNKSSKARLLPSKNTSKASFSTFENMSTATGAKKAERSSKTVEKIKQLSFGADESDSSDDEDGDDNRSFGNSDTKTAAGGRMNSCQLQRAATGRGEKSRWGVYDNDLLDDLRVGTYGEEDEIVTSSMQKDHSDSLNSSTISSSLVFTKGSLGSNMRNLNGGTEIKSSLSAEAKSVQSSDGKGGTGGRSNKLQHALGFSKSHYDQRGRQKNVTHKSNEMKADAESNKEVPLHQPAGIQDTIGTDMTTQTKKDVAGLDEYSRLMQQHEKMKNETALGEESMANSAEPKSDMQLQLAASAAAAEGSRILGRASGGIGLSVLSLSNAEPPPPPRIRKPWLLENNGHGESSRPECSESRSGHAESRSDLSLNDDDDDISILRLEGGKPRNGCDRADESVATSIKATEDFVTMPMPSPRYQTQTTVPRRLNANGNDRKNSQQKLKGFRIPERAKKQLALQDRTNSPPEDEKLNKVENSEHEN